MELANNCTVPGFSHVVKSQKHEKYFWIFILLICYGGLGFHVYRNVNNFITFSNETLYKSTKTVLKNNLKPSITICPTQSFSFYKLATQPFAKQLLNYLETIDFSTFVKRAIVSELYYVFGDKLFDVTINMDEVLIYCVYDGVYTLCKNSSLFRITMVYGVYNLNCLQIHPNENFSASRFEIVLFADNYNYTEVIAMVKYYQTPLQSFYNNHSYLFSSEQDSFSIYIHSSDTYYWDTTSFYVSPGTSTKVTVKLKLIVNEEKSECIDNKNIVNAKHPIICSVAKRQNTNRVPVELCILLYSNAD